MDNSSKPEITEQRKKTASFFFDLAKILFASVVVTVFMSVTDNAPDALTAAKLSVGAIGTLVLARIGFCMLNSENIE